MNDSNAHGGPLDSLDDPRLEALVAHAIEGSAEPGNLTRIEAEFIEVVRMVCESVRVDALELEGAAAGAATARAIDLASRLPSSAGSTLGAALAPWWSRVRATIAECRYLEPGSPAMAGLRGAMVRQASFSISEGPEACEFDLEIGTPGDDGRCRIRGQIQLLDESRGTSGSGVVAVPRDDVGDPVAHDVLDDDGFFDLQLPPGRYDLAFAIGDRSAALVPDLEVP